MNLDNRETMRDQHGRVVSWYVNLHGKYEPRPMCLFMDHITMETVNRAGRNRVVTRWNNETINITFI